MGDLTPHSEDFGQTLGTWGVGNGPYLVLPFLGPSTVRDTVGLGGNYVTSIQSWIDPDWVGWTIWGVCRAYFGLPRGLFARRTPQHRGPHGLGRAAGRGEHQRA